MVFPTGGGEATNPDNVEALYASVPHDRTDAYKASTFSGFVASPPPVGTFSFLLLYFPYTTVSTLLTSSAILDGEMPAPQF